MAKHIRKDAAFLAELVKRGKIDTMKAKQLAALAFIEVPDENAHPDWKAFVAEDKKKKMETFRDTHVCYVPTREEFPLHEFVMYHAGCQWYFNVKIEDDVFDVEVWEMQENHQYYCFTHRLVVRMIAGDNPGIECLQYEHEDYTRYARSGKLMVKPYKNTLDGNFHEALISINYLRRWCEYNHRLDRYCMTVQPDDVNKRSMTLKRRYGASVRVSFGPSIVYLNRLPKVACEGYVGDGHSVSAHQRRGYFVTLKAERYKNHKDYGIFEGHYRKPAWVGDRTTIVDGQIYTVIDETSGA